MVCPYSKIGRHMERTTQLHWAVRIISRAKYRDHTAPLFANLEILPLDELITYHRLKFMHSYHFQKLPISFAQLWRTNAERNPERVLRNAHDYFIP